MAMNSTTAASGSFGKLIVDDEWVTNVYGVEVSGEVNYEEIKRSGTRTVGHKAMSVSYSGTIKSYHMNNNFTKKIRQIANDKKGAYVTELIVSIEDPEAYDLSSEKIRIKGVQFTNIPVISFEHGSPIEQELQFVCEGFEEIPV